MSFVKISIFASDTQTFGFPMHPHSPGCDVMPGFTGVDTMIAMLSTIEAWLLVIPIVYEISKVLVPGIPIDMEDDLSIIVEKDPEHRLLGSLLLKLPSLLAPDLWVAEFQGLWTRTVSSLTPKMGKNSSKKKKKMRGGAQSEMEENNNGEEDDDDEEEEDEEDGDGGKEDTREVIRRRDTIVRMRPSTSSSLTALSEKHATDDAKTTTNDDVSVNPSDEILSAQATARSAGVELEEVRSENIALKIINKEGDGNKRLSTSHVSLELERARLVALIALKDSNELGGEEEEEEDNDVDGDDDNNNSDKKNEKKKQNKSRNRGKDSSNGSASSESCLPTWLANWCCIRWLCCVGASDTFVFSTFTQRLPRENAKWKMRKMKSLPSYFTLCRLEYEEMTLMAGSFAPSQSKWASNIFCFLFAICGLGHLFTRLGRRAWLLVIRKIVSFFFVSCGIWTPEFVGAYGIEHNLHKMSVV